MSAIFGILGLPDNDRSYVNVVGQQVVYDAIRELLNRHNADVEAAKSIFVERGTEDFKFRYKLPGGGFLQRRGGLAPSAAVKITGSWDVALPLEDFGAALGGSDVALAYMTLQELNTHLDTIMLQNINTVRREILKAMLDSVAYTHEDEIHGSLTVTPLANGDSVTYPPVLGTNSEATDNHYLESGYAASSISDSNNPYKTIRNELTEHFGVSSDGEDIVVFINDAQVDKTEALTDFVEVTDRYIRPGDNVAEVFGLPSTLPGRLIGRTNGVWVAEWRWVPANYMIGIHMLAPKPLFERVDPADTGLERGLALVAESDAYPLQGSQYRHRFGLAVANRLNGVALELGTGGTYTVPSGYSH